MTTEASPDLDRTLAALADPQRRRAIDHLRERPMRAGELATSLGVSPWTMSRHLHTLRLSGLVEETHPDFDARVRIYSLRPAPMLELRIWLEETEQMWRNQLSAFKAHVEAE